MDDLQWPENFMDISLKPFRWVFEHRKEFVEFTVNEMTQPTGLFKKWQDYCTMRIKLETEIKDTNEPLTFSD